MDYSQNGPFKVSIQETRFVLKTIKMIDPISKIWFQDVARKTIKGSIVLVFFVENPIEGEDGWEDFPDEDILDIELGAWKMYFEGAVNQYGNGIRVLLITPNGSHIPLAVELNFEVTNNMSK